jgi:preprotein translocase subunit SecG
MLLVFLNILFVLVAIAMIALILLQRGAGASAGSGFGGGASATVFGARGSASFLTKATKWLAIAFFSITLFMAWYATRQATSPQVGADLGVMS